MQLALRKIRTLLSVSFAEMTEYRTELFFWMIATALPLIMMGIWVPAARESEVGLSAQDMGRYYLAMFVIRQFTVVWLVYHFEFQLLTGRLSPMLLQPLDPVYRFLFLHLSEQWARLPLVLVMLLAVVLLYPEALGTVTVAGEERMWLPAVGDVVLGLLVMFCAFAVRYVIQAIFAMFSFWVERSARIEMMFFLPYMYLSGLFAPLETFDEPVRRVVMWTPFPYMVWWPSNVMIGREVIPLWHGFAALAIWGAVFFVIYRILWRIGLKRYSAMGA